MSTVVVSDSSPLHYLVLCDATEVLPRLFDRVVVPEAVVAELSHAHTPHRVREWLAAPPAWVEVRKATPSLEFGVKLGMGETQAIALAVELRPDAVLMDDHKATLAARQNGLVVVATLAILEQAAERGLLDLRKAVTALSGTNFRISPRILTEALARHEQRTRQIPPGRPTEYDSSHGPEP